MLHNYKNNSNEPEYDFEFEVFIMMHRLERAGFKEIFEQFIENIIYQFILRFGGGEHILNTSEQIIYQELEDPVNFYINRYEDYFDLINFIDDFELTLTFDILYSNLLHISKMKD